MTIKYMTAPKILCWSLVATLTLFLFRFEFTTPAPPLPSSGSSGAVASWEAPSNETLPGIRRTLKIYPADEIYFGDTLYIICEEENCSKKAYYAPVNFPTVMAARISISSDGIATDYSAKTELPEAYAPNWHVGPETNRTRFFGDKQIQFCKYFEFAPLEDWNAPFWSALREKLSAAHDGVVCKLHINNTYIDKDAKSHFMTYEREILVKPRPDGESNRLEDWYDTTPSKLFPIVYGEGLLQCKARKPNALKTKNKDCIKINGKSYDPWFFIRVGNRKPSVPNNPTTLAGWRKLEAEFAPSTLRDEITLTRLQLEYYDADEGEASDAALKALVDWLAQRPEPQRVVLSQSLLSKRAKFKETPLEAKNATLCDALISAFPVETPTTDDAK